LPAGLGILLCNKKIIEKSKKLTKLGFPTGSYHSFSLIIKKALQFQTLETPNVLGLYLLDKVLADMLTKGMDKIRSEQLQKYKLLTDYFKVKPGFSLYIKMTKSDQKLF